MIEQDLRERIDRLLDDDTQPDWSEVAARAAAVDRRRPRWRRAVAPGTRSLVAAAVVGAAIAAVPALAFGPAARDLISSRHAAPPQLQATVTGMTVHRRVVGEMVTVTFMVGEPGKRPGTGIPARSLFMILLIPKHGAPSNQFTVAKGANGRYTATAWAPRSGVSSIWIGSWLNRVETPTAASGFWLPVTILNSSY